MHVLCNVNTRQRWGSTLPLTLQSILSQSRLPDEFLLIDDSPPEGRPDMWRHPVLGPLISTMQSKMKVKIINGPGRGPHHCHEFARTSEQAKELVWRVDDDECPEPDVLARLEKHIEHNPLDRIGAAAGLVLGPNPGANPLASSRVEDLRWCKNIQWYRWPKNAKGFYPQVDVGHLHSSYLYRKDAASFPMNLSPVGHTEETQHTMRIKLAGFRLLVDTGITTWHYRQSDGGIRSQQGDYDGDRKQFDDWCDSIGIKFRRRVPIWAGQGWGDCFALLQAMPDIIKHHRDAEFIQVFVRPELLDQFKSLAGGVVTVDPLPNWQLWNFQGEFNVYCWMGNHPNFKGNLVAAYRQMYTELPKQEIAPI